MCFSFQQSSGQYNYDHVGRLTEALTGDEATGGSVANGPYKETMQYDVWNNMVGRTTRLWSKDPESFQVPYSNNRRQASTCCIAWQYDADGRVTGVETAPTAYTYDAAGQRRDPSVYLMGPVTWSLTPGTLTYDGDGQVVKEQYGGAAIGELRYHIRSSLLNQPILTISPQDGTSPQTRYIYVNGARLAKVDAHSDGPFLTFEHSNPVTGTTVWGVFPDRPTGLVVQTDPFGADVGTHDPGPDEPGDAGQYYEPHEFGNAEDPSMGCTADGISIDCSTAMRFLMVGAAGLAPTNSNRAVADPSNPGQRMLVANGPIFGDFNLGRYQRWVDDGRRVDTESSNNPIGTVMGADDDGNPIEMDVYGTNRGEIAAYWEFLEFGSFFQRPQKTRQTQNPLNGVTGGASGLIDPCAGVTADKLDYSQEHFTDRHILNSDPAFLNRSKYVFNLGIGSRISAESDPKKQLEIARQAVIGLNTFTFNSGGRYQNSPVANIVFVYGFPRASGPGVDVEWFVGVMGKDQSHAGELTNVNTLILDRDCRTVITSNPGLPNGPYNYGGTPPYYGKP